MAESHKTLQAIICDILFPCGEQEKDLFVSKIHVWERDGSTSASKTEERVRLFCKNQFEKQNFAKGAKILRLSQKYSKTNSAKL